jgi:hydrogenase maturation protease
MTAVNGARVHNSRLAGIPGWQGAGRRPLSDERAVPFGADDPGGALRTLVLGVGNSLLTDEGTGVHVVAYLAREYPDLAGVTYLDGGTLSFTLAGPIEDHDALIVVDAAQLGAPPGTVRVFEGTEMDRFLGRAKLSVHEVSLVDLMDIARLTDHLPARRAIVGVQPAEVGWGSEPTPEVARAVPDAAERVLGLIRTWQAEAAASA